MKKILFIFALFFMFLLSGCTNSHIKNYYLTDDFILIEVYDDGTEVKLGEFSQELIDKIKNIKITNDYYVINNIKTNIKARKIKYYFVSDDLNLAVKYDDGYVEYIGEVDDRIYSAIKNITISENGNYVINDYETNIKASVSLVDIIVEDEMIYAIGHDGSKMNVGKIDDFIINNIKTIEVNDDGYYVINGIVSSIKAYDVYHISFDTGAMPIKAQKIKQGDVIEEPKVTRKNFYIIYWTYEGKKWDFENDVPTCDMTLKAEWKEKAKLTYHFNLEGFDEKSNYVDKGDIINEPTYNYPGYDIEYSTNFPFTIGDESITVEVTLTPKKFNIYLNTVKGNLKQDIIEVVYKESFTLPILFENGYDFLGWFNGDEKINDFIFNNTSDLTLEAKWKINENNYIYKYGSYPQSHVSDEKLISELNKITETNALGYVTYEGNQYVKMMAYPINDTSVYYSDGTLAKQEETWFKVEPIEWKLVKRYDNTKLLAPVYIIDAIWFDQTSSNYSNSFLRSFLNSTFLNKAFTIDEQNMLIERTVLQTEAVVKDNSVTVSTFELTDKINTFSVVYDLILDDSTDQEKINFVLDEKPITDYALAKYAKAAYGFVQNNRINYGCWWTRDQYQNSNTSFSCIYYSYDKKFENSSSSKGGIGIYPYIKLSNE